MPITRAVIGTKAFDRAFLTKIVGSFHDRIAVGIDVREDVIQTHGWQIGEIDVEFIPFLKQLEEIGVETIICTDIGRDGMMNGPNYELIERVLTQTSMKVIASGGVSEMTHLEQFARLKAANFAGVIIGKALYEQKIDLREAIERFQGD